MLNLSLNRNPPGLDFTDYGLFAKLFSVESNLVVEHQKPTCFEVLIGGFHVGALLFSWTLFAQFDVDHAPSLRIIRSTELKLLVVDALHDVRVVVNEFFHIPSYREELRRVSAI